METEENIELYKKSKLPMILIILGIFLIIVIAFGFMFFHHWGDKVAYDCKTYLINGTFPSIYERLEGWHIYEPISIMYFTDKEWKMQESTIVKVDLSICKQFKNPNISNITQPRE